MVAVSITFHAPPHEANQNLWPCKSDKALNPGPRLFLCCHLQFEAAEGWLRVELLKLEVTAYSKLLPAEPSRSNPARPPGVQIKSILRLFKPTSRT
jgi:hypothetical protein